MREEPTVLRNRFTGLYVMDLHYGDPEIGCNWTDTLRYAYIFPYPPTADAFAAKKDIENATETVRINLAS